MIIKTHSTDRLLLAIEVKKKQMKNKADIPIKYVIRSGLALTSTNIAKAQVTIHNTNQIQKEKRK